MKQESLFPELEVLAQPSPINNTILSDKPYVVGVWYYSWAKGTFGLPAGLNPKDMVVIKDQDGKRPDSTAKAASYYIWDGRPQIYGGDIKAFKVINYARI